MYKELDCCGLDCPFPVVNTKRAIQEGLSQGLTELKVIVDNPVAASNLKNFAEHHDYEVELREDGALFEILFRFSGEPTEAVLDRPIEEEVQVESSARGKTILITNDLMGEGDPALGKILIKAFIFSLTQADQLPERIIFYNRGVFLLTEDAETCQDLKNLEKAGVELWPCGTCLDFYKLKDQVKIGTVSNMYSIVEALNEGRDIVRI